MDRRVVILLSPKARKGKAVFLEALTRAERGMADFTAHGLDHAVFHKPEVFFQLTKGQVSPTLAVRCFAGCGLGSPGSGRSVGAAGSSHVTKTHTN